MIKNIKQVGIVLIPIFIIVLFIMTVKSNSYAVELPFFEEGVIYKSWTDNESDREVVVDNVIYFVNFNQETGDIYFIGKPELDEGWGDLWVSSINNPGSKTLISKNAVSTSFSHDNKRIAVSDTSAQLNVIDLDTLLSKRIGIHGGSSIFSSDGRYLAYGKLADKSFDGNIQSLFEFSPYGIAIYDFETGEEKIITDGGGDDYGPVGFSGDMRKLYFNSTRPYENDKGNHVASLWVVDIESMEVERLTNKTPTFNQSIIPTINTFSSIWSSDRKKVISSNGSESGVWMFVFDQEGLLSRAKQLTGGNSPYWFTQDETIIHRIVDNGVSKWITVDINKF